MYAQSNRSKVYHLLYSTFDYTLCGQRLNSEAATHEPGLRLVSEQPPNRLLCRQCEKMEERSNGKVKVAGALQLVQIIAGAWLHNVT